MRPEAFTDEKRERYLGCLRSGMRLGEAALACNVDRTIVWEYRKRHPEFVQLMNEAEADYCDQIEKRLIEIINTEKSSLASIVFYLTNRCPERWRDMRNIAPKVTTTISTTDETLKAIMGRLNKEFGDKADEAYDGEPATIQLTQKKTA